MLDCQEFINTNEIAKGLSPYNLYIPICDYWMIFNNSNPSIELIAEGNFNTNLKIENNSIFETLKSFPK